MYKKALGDKVQQRENCIEKYTKNNAAFTNTGLSCIIHLLGKKEVHVDNFNLKLENTSYEFNS